MQKHFTIIEGKNLALFVDLCYTNLPVSDAAKVTFHFKETISIESQHQVAVLHFEEDGVQQPDITDIAVQNNNEMTDLSFDTEGFSVYAMVTWIWMDKAMQLSISMRILQNGNLRLSVLL